MARDHMDKEKYFIVDAYNHQIWPQDEYAKQAISVDIATDDGITDQEYLDKIKAGLAEAFDRFKPDFIVYNAGTDCLDGDPLGHLTISGDTIVARDELVFKYAYQEAKVPIVMLLSGGFCNENAPVITQSIKNLITKFELM